MDPRFGGFGEFELLDVLGRGAIGIVYRAHDRRLNRIVALKIPYFGDARELKRKERFLRECFIHKSFGSSNRGIPEMLMVGKNQGVPFSIREFIPGATFEQWLATGRMSLVNGVRILQEVASTLGFIHDRGIAHRDIQASDILIASDGRPKLIGFGSALSLSVVPKDRSEHDVRDLQRILAKLFQFHGQPAPEHLLLDEASAAAFGQMLRTWLTESE